MTKPIPTHERVRELLAYDRKTGIFRWKVVRHRVPIGSIAGSKHCDGYWQIRMDGHLYMAHRLAWLWVFGVWPITMIDHKNGDKACNCIENLREATKSQNKAN